jgi:uncharacterized protein YgbK (DUF1537 family)
VTASGVATDLEPWPDDPLPTIRSLGANRVVLALDDDPTGTQTVRGVPVLTRWDEARLGSLLDHADSLAYLLTNSRSKSAEVASAQARAIGALLAATARATCPWSVISRSDSTLRGHFPHEVDALVEGLKSPESRVLLAPFFGDGGRVTIDGVHYLRRGESLVPAANTEFAADPVFGYRSSDLRAWVAERDPGRTQVRSIGLAAIRSQGPEAVRDALVTLPPRGVLAADAVEERDIEVVALGALLAELEGLPLVARTAASYVRARAGQPPAVPLTDAEVPAGTPGLVVVGSHVPTTTAQLEALLDQPPVPIAAIELPVEKVLAGPPAERAAVDRVATAADRALADGRTPVIWTSRDLARGSDRSADLELAARVSRALVAVVTMITRRPAWVLAKGGITSSDVATEALAIAEAEVVGPLLPGVPLWRSGIGSRYPGLGYVVFPGNVGGPSALRDAVGRMSRV